MGFTVAIVATALGLLLGILALLEAGRWLGRRDRALDPPREAVVLGPLEGAVFTLLGLLLAFTFSGAAARFDVRRQLVAQEANDIGTVWLRLELLPADAQPPLRALLREYLDSRIDSYRQGVEAEAAAQVRARSAALQRSIWSSAVAACSQSPQPAACTLLLPALNDMLDITTTRLVAGWTHPPAILYGMLIALALAAALLSGYATAANVDRSWLHRLLFAAAIAASVYVILDLEYPRSGLIRVDSVDRVLIDLRQSFGEG